jgi:outer membrane protein assembly factor BamB
MPLARSFLRPLFALLALATATLVAAPALAQLTAEQSEKSIAIGKKIDEARKLTTAKKLDEATAALLEAEQALAVLSGDKGTEALARRVAQNLSALEGVRTLLAKQGVKLPVRTIGLAAPGAAALPGKEGPGEWSRFRGPNGTGVSTAAIPANWTAEDYNWKIEVPGDGHSQPVLWGDKIFLTTAVGEQRMVLCLSAADGKTVWSKPFNSKNHTKHKFNSFASATPCCDEKHVYVLFSTPESYTVLALDHAGSEKWSFDLGPFESQHSCGASPIVYEDMVIVPNEQDGPSNIAALDRESGKLRWKGERKQATQGTAYSTPMVFQPDRGAPQLIFNSRAHGVSGVDPKTGKTLWDSPLLTMRSCSSPVLAAGLLTGSCGSGAGGNYLIAVKPGTTGDVSATNLAYKLEGSATMPYVPTPIALGDLLFLISDKGTGTCVNAKTGETIWQKRLGGNFFGSPVIAQDRMYVMSCEGYCHVLSATKEYKEIAKVDLAEGSHSTPAIAGGKIYLRTFHHLMSLGGK